MDLNAKSAVPVTPAKTPQTNRSKTREISKLSENRNPNLKTPNLKPSKSPAIKSASKTQNSAASRNPNAITFPSPRQGIRQRKFVVVTKRNSGKEKPKDSCKCEPKVSGHPLKCVCVAFENLRNSQEDFFKQSGGLDDNHCKKDEGKNVTVADDDKPLIENGEERVNDESAVNGLNDGDPDEIEPFGSLNLKRRRDKLMEEARQSIPEHGSGRVMHLVNAFERLLMIRKSEGFAQNNEKKSEDDKKVLKWALPGLQANDAPETQVSSSSFCQSDFILTSESLGLDSRGNSSLNSSHGSISSRTSGGGRRSRRNSIESTGTFGGSRLKKKKLKATSLKPFKLRTEQRGRQKQEELMKKVQQVMIEEEKQRIPIAQGLPWTTDEPECLVKPPVKEITRPVDLVLHSDVRAVERSEFDQQVAEKMSLVEQYRLERERQQKLEEEDEIKRLRKELVPRAQPMPYFDRPFIPRRSMKHPTIPREPRFHVPQHKKIKCCLSWDDMYSHRH